MSTAHHRKIVSVPDLPILEKYVSTYQTKGGKTILHFFNPETGLIEGPYTEGKGKTPKVAEILDAALEAVEEYGKRCGATISAEYRLPSGRKLCFLGTARQGNVLFFERR